MPEWVNWIPENADKLGVVAVLCMVVGALCWVLRHLYLEQKACEDGRREDQKRREAERVATQTEIGELKGEVRYVAAKLEVTEAHRTEHIESLKELHRSILEAVAKDRR